MTIYVTGAQKSSLFSSEKVWTFKEAIEKVQNGDVIELQNGYCPQIDGDLTISKNITISGQCVKSETGKSENTSTFNAPVHISKNATVTLKNLIITVHEVEKNCLTIRDGSSLYIENVDIENVVSEGETYPIVWVDGKSHFEMSGSRIHKSGTLDSALEVYIKNGKADITDSVIDTIVELKDGSALSLVNSQINNQTENALFLENSRAIISNSTLIGGRETKETLWPCVKTINSKIDITDSSIQQDNVVSSLSAENSNLKIKNGYCSSVKLTNSTAKFTNLVIVETLFVYDGSILQADEINICGKNPKKINFWANGNSKINVETINFGIETKPNVRIEDTVNFNVQNLNAVRFDSENTQFLLDEEGHIIVLKHPAIDVVSKKNSNAPKNHINKKNVSASEQLKELIGVQSVKSKIEEFVAIAQMNKRREAQGLTNSATTLHSLYLGNPGTGKTTVARIVGRLLYEKQIISSDRFIEVTRSDLVAKFNGQTASKTRDVLKSALGGVLFIDEAYTLASGGSDDYGLEAIDEILKFMEDHRSDIVIIFAGYTNEMEKFLDMNQGLKSRIPNMFDFEDYTAEELVKIGLLLLHKQDYQIDEQAYADLIKHNLAISNDNSNGRWVRNLNDQILRKLAIRLTKDENAVLTKITTDDLKAAML